MDAQTPITATYGLLIVYDIGLQRYKGYKVKELKITQFLSNLYSKKCVN